MALLLSVGSFAQLPSRNPVPAAYTPPSPPTIRLRTCVSCPLSPPRVSSSRGVAAAVAASQSARGRGSWPIRSSKGSVTTHAARRPAATQECRGRCAPCTRRGQATRSTRMCLPLPPPRCSAGHIPTARATPLPPLPVLLVPRAARTRREPSRAACRSRSPSSSVRTVSAQDCSRSMRPAWRQSRHSHRGSARGGCYTRTCSGSRDGYQPAHSMRVSSLMSL